MKYRARPEGGDWFEMDLTVDGADLLSDDGWAGQAAEAFVMGMHEELQLSCGETVEIEILSPTSKHYRFEVMFSKIPHAEVVRTGK